MTYKERKRSLFFGLPFSFTVYTINDEIVSVRKGLFRVTEDDAYLYKVVDVRMEQSLWQRICGIGTVHCFGGDVTHPALKLANIKHAREIKDHIVKQSESERLRKRTLNTMNINGHPDLSQMVQETEDITE